MPNVTNAIDDTRYLALERLAFQSLINPSVRRNYRVVTHGDRILTCDGRSYWDTPELAVRAVKRQAWRAFKCNATRGLDIGLPVMHLFEKGIIKLRLFDKHGHFVEEVDWRPFFEREA